MSNSLNNPRSNKSVSNIGGKKGTIIKNLKSEQSPLKSHRGSSAVPLQSALKKNKFDLNESTVIMSQYGAFSDIKSVRSMNTTAILKP